MAAFKLLPLPEIILPTTGLIGVVLTAGGFAAGWWRRQSMIETARWVDSRQKLQERLSTALEVSNSRRDEKWQALLVGDAAKHVHNLRASQLLPYQLPEASKWAFMVLLVACGLGFVPEYRSKEFVQKQRDKEVIQETGRHLAELTRLSLEQRPPALEPTRKALDSVGDVGDHLAKAQLTRNDALKDLANVAEKLKSEEKELGKNPALKALERAARSSNRGGSPSSAELQKQIESLQEAFGNKAADSDALEKLREKLQQAKQTAAGLPNQDSAAGEAAREQLGESLAELARQAKEAGLSLPSLDDAIAALAASQIDQLLRDLDIAENSLEKLQELAQTLEQLQMAAQKLGRDLGEQLENGQAEAAKTTLERMVKDLQSAKLAPEQLKQMLEEVERAVAPAGHYGKVAQFLKQATSQMQQGQKPAAAQSLADAARELENLLQQLQDAKSLMASLDALQRAQRYIGNGHGWG
ncbi:MAG: hypothetical protein HY735_23600 [Verrucomicrobia bacterium]|nr:hypothetical protein [Verrucomicrobiota bacterium]